MLEYGPAVALRVAIGSATAFLGGAAIGHRGVQPPPRRDRGGRRRLVSTEHLVDRGYGDLLQLSLSPALFNGFSQTGGRSRSCGRRGPVPFLNVGSDGAALGQSLAVADWGVKIAIAL